MIMVQHYSSEVILKCILNVISSLNGIGIILGGSYVTLHQNTCLGNRWLRQMNLN